MIYYNSILLCQNKTDFIKLCKVINSYTHQSTPAFKPIAIGKLIGELWGENPRDKRIIIFHPDLFFVIVEDMNKPLAGHNKKTRAIADQFFSLCRDNGMSDFMLCEDCFDMGLIYEDTNEYTKGILQENLETQIIFLPDDGIVQNEYIKNIG